MLGLMLGLGDDIEAQGLFMEDWNKMGFLIWERFVWDLCGYG
jgi:hypothetical protein